MSNPRIYPQLIFFVAMAIAGASTAETNSLPQTEKQIYEDYSTMRKQYREAYHTYDPMHPQYKEGNPRANIYNKKNTAALARAEAARQRVMGSIENGQAQLYQEIRRARNQGAHSDLPAP